MMDLVDGIQFDSWFCATNMHSTAPCYGRLGIKLLATAEAFAAVEAFVTGAVTHRHMPATGARGCVLLKMRHRIAQALYLCMGQRGWSVLMTETVAVTISVSGGLIDIKHLGVF